MDARRSPRKQPLAQRTAENIPAHSGTPPADSKRVDAVSPQHHCKTTPGKSHASGRTQKQSPLRHAPGGSQPASGQVACITPADAKPDSGPILVSPTLHAGDMAAQLSAEQEASAMPAAASKTAGAELGTSATPGATSVQPMPSPACTAQAGAGSTPSWWDLSSAKGSAPPSVGAPSLSLKEFSIMNNPLATPSDAGFGFGSPASVAAASTSGITSPAMPTHARNIPIMPPPISAAPSPHRDTTASAVVQAGSSATTASTPAGASTTPAGGKTYMPGSVSVGKVVAADTPAAASPGNAVTPMQMDSSQVTQQPMPEGFSLTPGAAPLHASTPFQLQPCPPPLDVLPDAHSAPPSLQPTPTLTASKALPGDMHGSPVPAATASPAPAALTAEPMAGLGPAPVGSAIEDTVTPAAGHGRPLALPILSLVPVDGEPDAIQDTTTAAQAASSAATPTPGRVRAGSRATTPSRLSQVAFACNAGTPTAADVPLPDALAPSPRLSPRPSPHPSPRRSPRTGVKVTPVSSNLVTPASQAPVAATPLTAAVNGLLASAVTSLFPMGEDSEMLASPAPDVTADTAACSNDREAATMGADVQPVDAVSHGTNAATQDTAHVSGVAAAQGSDVPTGAVVVTAEPAPSAAPKHGAATSRGSQMAAHITPKRVTTPITTAAECVAPMASPAASTHKRTPVPSSTVAAAKAPAASPDHGQLAGDGLNAASPEVGGVATAGKAVDSTPAQSVSLTAMAGIVVAGTTTPGVSQPTGKQHAQKEIEQPGDDAVALGGAEDKGDEEESSSPAQSDKDPAFAAIAAAAAHGCITPRTAMRSARAVGPATTNAACTGMMMGTASKSNVKRLLLTGAVRTPVDMSSQPDSNTGGSDSMPTAGKSISLATGATPFTGHHSPCTIGHGAVNSAAPSAARLDTAHATAANTPLQGSSTCKPTGAGTAVGSNSANASPFVPLSFSPAGPTSGQPTPTLADVPVPTPPAAPLAAATCAELSARQQMMSEMANAADDTGKTPKARQTPGPAAVSTAANDGKSSCVETVAGTTPSPVPVSPACAPRSTVRQGPSGTAGLPPPSPTRSSARAAAAVACTAAGIAPSPRSSPPRSPRAAAYSNKPASPLPAAAPPGDGTATWAPASPRAVRAHTPPASPKNAASTCNASNQLAGVAVQEAGIDPVAAPAAQGLEEAGMPVPGVPTVLAEPEGAVVEAAAAARTPAAPASRSSDVVQCKNALDVDAAQIESQIQEQQAAGMPETEQAAELDQHKDCVDQPPAATDKQAAAESVEQLVAEEQQTAAVDTFQMPAASPMSTKPAAVLTDALAEDSTAGNGCSVPEQAATAAMPAAADASDNQAATQQAGPSITAVAISKPPTEKHEEPEARTAQVSSKRAGRAARGRKAAATAATEQIAVTGADVAAPPVAETAPSEATQPACADKATATAADGKKRGRGAAASTAASAEEPAPAPSRKVGSRRSKQDNQLTTVVNSERTDRQQAEQDAMAAAAAAAPKGKGAGRRAIKAKQSAADLPADTHAQEAAPPAGSSLNGKAPAIEHVAPEAKVTSKGRRGTAKAEAPSTDAAVPADEQVPAEMVKKTRAKRAGGGPVQIPAAAEASEHAAGAAAAAAAAGETAQPTQPSRRGRATKASGSVEAAAVEQIYEPVSSAPAKPGRRGKAAKGPSNDAAIDAADAAEPDAKVAEVAATAQPAKRSRRVAATENNDAATQKDDVAQDTVVEQARPERGARSASHEQPVAGEVAGAVKSRGRTHSAAVAAAEEADVAKAAVQPEQPELATKARRGKAAGAEVVTVEPQAAAAAARGRRQGAAVNNEQSADPAHAAEAIAAMAEPSQAPRSKRARGATSNHQTAGVETRLAVENTPTEVDVPAANELVEHDNAEAPRKGVRRAGKATGAPAPAAAEEQVAADNAAAVRKGRSKATAAAAAAAVQPDAQESAKVPEAAAKVKRASEVQQQQQDLDADQQTGAGVLKSKRSKATQEAQQPDNDQPVHREADSVAGKGPARKGRKAQHQEADVQKAAAVKTSTKKQEQTKPVKAAAAAATHGKRSSATAEPDVPAARATRSRRA